MGPNSTLDDNVKKLAGTLSARNVNVFGNIHNMKRKLLARIDGVQKRLPVRKFYSLIKFEIKLQKELEWVLLQEELLWFQRSRKEWICSWDKNTKFFHVFTIG